MYHHPLYGHGIENWQLVLWGVSQTGRVGAKGVNGDRKKREKQQKVGRGGIGGGGVHPPLPLVT